MENQPIILECILNVQISKVWSAITDKVEMRNWYFDLEEFRPEVGFKFEFTGGPEDGVQYIHHCEVTDVVPQQKITYSWSYAGFPGKSFVMWELTEQGDKTLLRLTHSGIGSFPKETKDFARENFEAGWNQIIKTGLKEYLEK